MAKKPVMREFIRVQGKCYLVKDGVTHAWGSGALKEEYGRHFVETLESYDTFCMNPSNSNYEAVKNNEWNLYHEVKHDIKEGPFPLIKALIEHVFYEDVRMGMEYLWNIWNKPLQQLPALGLVSVKKGTGKSTMLDLLHIMLQGNAVDIDHDDLIGDFNGAWAGKLVVTIDEKPEGKLINKELQKLKKLITSHTVMYKQKYIPDTQMLNFAKFIFASNDRNNIMKIEPENTRFWIIDVPILENPDHEIFVKMKKEIGHFVHYLQNIFVARPARGRLYFAEHEFQTDATRRVQENSKSQLHEEILSLIENAAITKGSSPMIEGSGIVAAWRNDSTILATARDIRIGLMSVGVRINEKYIKTVIEDEMQAVKVVKQMRYSNGIGEGTKGFPYIFKYELTDEYFKYIPNFDPPENKIGPPKRPARKTKVVPLKIEFRELKEN